MKKSLVAVLVVSFVISYSSLFAEEPSQVIQDNSTDMIPYTGPFAEPVPPLTQAEEDALNIQAALDALDDADAAEDSDAAANTTDSQAALNALNAANPTAVAANAAQPLTEEDGAAILVLASLAEGYASRAEADLVAARKLEEQIQKLLTDLTTALSVRKPNVAGYRDLRNYLIGKLTTRRGRTNGAIVVLKGLVSNRISGNNGVPAVDEMVEIDGQMVRVRGRGNIEDHSRDARTAAESASNATDLGEATDLMNSARDHSRITASRLRNIQNLMTAWRTGWGELLLAEPLSTIQGGSILDELLTNIQTLMGAGLATD
jgi:hypothetical protein